MRKIFIHRELNSETWNIRNGVFQKVDDKIELLKEYSEEDTPFSRYPKDFDRKTLEKLVMVDQILNEQGEELLTEEEMYYIVDPVRLLAPATATATPEEMARLAGYRVNQTEKSVEYFDDLKVESDD